MKKVLAAMCLLMLTGCSAHISPLQESPGNKIIYATEDEDRVFAEVYAAITEKIPYSPIADVNKAIRGYSVRDYYGGDYIDYLVRVFPAIGITSGQEQVKGYYAEVTTDGTMPTGASNARELYENICNRLASFARPVNVLDIRPGKYINERDEFRLNTAPSLRENGTIRLEGGASGSSMADEIQKLNDLKSQGLITEEEYQKGKDRILSK